MVFTRFEIRKYLAALVLLSVSAWFFSFNAAAKQSDTLLADVVALKLGMDGYVIGEHLTDAQKKFSDAHLDKEAYKGTYKFSAGDLFVVVDSKTNRILALYKRKKDADKKQLKQMVVELMDHFDAPTTMAHNKILYWAFNKHGAVSEDDFSRAKEIKQVPDLGIIATVKLNSEMEISPDPTEEEGESSENKVLPTGTVYYIITSDPLVKQFMDDH